MGKPIWFPFFVNDFLSSGKVAVMTTEEAGAYVFLLSHEWQDPTCSLPSDDDSLQKLGRFSGDLTRLRACFTVKRGRLVNERLLSEWVKVQEHKALATKSANMRWHPHNHASALPTHIHRQSSSPSPSPSPSQKNRRTKEPSPSEKNKSSGATQDFAPPLSGVVAWDSFSEAYQRRYGVPPRRNHKVNSNLKELVKRLGAEEAPLVAAFYLSHNRQLYVAARHDTTLLVRDCEGLRTQWATGVKATSGEAKNAELQDDAQAQVNRVRANIEARKHGSA